MNDEMNLLTKEEAKELYFKCYCSWFYIGRETNYYDILKTKMCKADNFEIAKQLLKPQLYIDIFPDNPFKGIIAYAEFDDTIYTNEYISCKNVDIFDIEKNNN